MTWRSSQDFAQDTSAFRRAVAAMVRRFVVTLTTGTRWQFLGHRGVNGDRDETVELELFPGIGFFSRPPANGKPEAIAVAPAADVKSSAARVAIATRDEKTRQAVAGDLAEDETIVYNSAAQVRVKADGTVEIRLANGVAVALATKADVAKIETAIAGATVVGGDGGASLRTTILTGLATSLHGSGGATPWPVGTTVLKGQ